MKTLLRRLLIDNWPRKLLSVAIAVIVWMLASRSMTISKVVPNVPVRVTNLPSDKTVEGMLVDGTLSKRVSLTLIGHRSGLDEIQAKDLEVVIDAKDKAHEWIENIDKKNLVGLSTDFDVLKHISRITPLEMIVHQTNLVTERIPITVTQPIGEVPKGYQFLDIYPYQLSVTVKGPEEAVKKLKSRGLKLTFNLNDISKEELDAIRNEKAGDEISFFVPDSWKKISLPLLSEVPVEIDDPRASSLRIDFSRQDLLPIDFPIPISLFFPADSIHTINPKTHSLATNKDLIKKNGIVFLNVPLYAQGVSHTFLETVKDMVEVVVIAGSKREVSWNPQFISPQKLEDRYVSKVIESNDFGFGMHPNLLDDYLRNRFRNYMNRFRIYTQNQAALSLNVEVEKGLISVTLQDNP